MMYSKTSQKLTESGNWLCFWQWLMCEVMLCFPYSFWPFISWISYLCHSLVLFSCLHVDVYWCCNSNVYFFFFFFFFFHMSNIFSSFVCAYDTYMLVSAAELVGICQSTWVYQYKRLSTVPGSNSNICSNSGKDFLYTTVKEVMYEIWCQMFVCLLFFHSVIIDMPQNLCKC